MIVLVIVCSLLAVLLRASQPWLNAGGAALGRGIAWWCSGGLGWAFARPAIERERGYQALGDLQARLAAERMRFPAGERVRALQAGGVAYPRESFGSQLDRYELRTGWHD